MTELRDLLERLLNREDLAEPEAAALLVALTDPSMAPAMAGALLAALRSKGLTADEVRGFASAMRRLARRPALPPGSPAIDIVGTGGDASGSFNISTGASLLTAAMGVRVVKHGNRSISSRSGSADLLECLGLPLPLDEERAGDCLGATGFTFLFAPHYHPAMKEIAPVRRALGVRTVFNLLGPLTNPAEPPFGLIGAYSRDAARLMAQTLAGMPIQRVFVVHGEPGWDEPTPCGPFELYDVTPGHVVRTERDPLAFGLERCTPQSLAGGDAAHNAVGMRAVFTGQDRGPHRDALVLNAALALEVTGAVSDPHAAIRAASDALDRGDGARLLDKLAAFGRWIGRGTVMGLLSDMAAGSELRLAAARAVVSDAELAECCAALPRVQRLQLPARGFDLIAELKLRSPALGDLSARTMDPVARLRSYAEAGAAICSILTEPARFDGDLSHLRQAATVLAPYGVPAMRKDFLVDPYQVLEARAHGAGGVLLIVRMVERERLAAMLDTAAGLGLFVLLEAFDARDLEIAGELAVERRGRDEQVLMGLNCRDLQTLQIDFARFERLRDRLPGEWPAVAESGVLTPEDAATVAALGYRLALVGTTLMQRDDPAQAVRELLAAGRGAAR